MQRDQTVRIRLTVATLLMIGLVWSGAPSAWGAEGGAAISGVVRDAQGVAQMGALVQVLAANSVTVATAFTDARGHYTVPNLKVGRYIVRASATLFVPATRGNLQLRSGVTTVVNLTLAALFDTSSWLPAVRRRADEPDDDWKWTLRATGNRPILRLVEDGTLIEVSSSATEAAQAAQTRVRETVATNSGEFGLGGIHNILAIHRSMVDGSDLVMRSDLATNVAPGATLPSQEFEAGYEKRQGFDGAARTVVSYKSHPELAAVGNRSGVQAFAIANAQRLGMGDVMQVEFGGRLEAVNAGQTGFAMRPFVRVTSHPMGVWTLHYRMASERQTQGFEDVTTGENDVPVALVKNGKLALEQGRHQEVAVDRKAGRGTVSFAYYHDALGQVAVSGGGVTPKTQVADGVMLDPTTGAFRTLTNGYATNGMRLTVSTPLMEGLWIAAEYSTGEAIGSETGGLTAYEDALAGLHAESAQAGTLALKGKIKGTGTRIRASYRWQPARMVTAVDPYSVFSDQAYLSCQLRQPIRWKSRMPSGFDATIDVTNLLAAGYRPFVSADGQTLYFAQAPRTIQGGVSFTF